jgi:hypothetical protein
MAKRATQKQKDKGQVRPQVKAASASLSPKARAQYEATIEKLDAQLQPLTDAIRDSQRLNEDDFAIRINAQD